MLVDQKACDIFSVRSYDDHGTFREANDRDCHTSVRFWTHTNTDGEIGIVGFEKSTGHSCVYHQGEVGYVVIYPSHPAYASYLFPEVEVEPSSGPEDVVLGKIIANWNLTESF